MSNDRIQINMGLTEEKFPTSTHMYTDNINEVERKDIISKFNNSGIYSKENFKYIYNKF